MFFVLATVFLAILSLIWIARSHLPSRKSPPGPLGLPIVGYLPFLGKYAHETFVKLGYKYGSIFSVRLGNQTVIVLNDWAALKAALVDQAHTFSARPPMFIFDSNVKKRDIATNHGPIWKAQRVFAVQALKLAKADREALYMKSVNDLIRKFEDNNGQVMRIEDDFFLPIFNIIWKIACNKTIEGDEAKGKHFFEILKGNFYGLRNDSPLNFMPYLRFLVPGGLGYWTYKKYHNMLWSYLEKEIEEHLSTFTEGHPRDFLDAYIEEMKIRERKDKAEPPYTVENIAGSLYDFFLGGVETTSNTLTWSLLILSIWPQCQQKIQEEIDDVIGSGRMPTLDDMSRLPYLKSATLEIHRYITIVPFSFFHSALKDTEVLGYRIPKGCVLIENIYGVHRDPKCWDKPYEFRPERFLDSQNEVRIPEYLIPFSIGARVCLGESLAKQQIFLFLACLLQKFDFQVPPDVPTPSLEPNIGLTLMSKPYPLLVKIR